MTDFDDFCIDVSNLILALDFDKFSESEWELIREIHFILDSHYSLD